MSKTYFTSDQHFYHANVIKYCNRPFKSVEEMNEALVYLFNTIVYPEDTVYHLGDFSLSHRGVQVFLPQLNGTHHLIAGNHDRVHPAHYRKNEEKRERMYKLYQEAGFKTIQLHDRFEFHHGILAELHHLPYKPPEGSEGYDQRYLEYRPIDHSNYLLHGHVHEKWRKRGKMINVGVDVWDFKPVSIEQIQDLIAKGYEHNE